MENKTKTEAELLKEKLCYQKKNAYKRLTDEDIAAADRYCGGYRAFLDRAKTEREAVDAAIALAKENGFTPFVPGTALKPGDKIYCNNRGKALYLAVIGRRPLADGVTIAAAHIDSPRLDCKPNPLYEDTELAYLDTHYYGGIKNYQWSAIPLALHGIIMRKDGTAVTVTIGEDVDDPVFVVTDLLPHLDRNQAKRTDGDMIKGEDLNLLIGSRPFRDDEASEAVKLNILRLLNEKYGVIEEDFLTAELEIVPAWHAKDVGLDRSLIGAYGHDDRVCAYPALTALFDCGTPAYTAVTVLADKEEIGSEGNTGMQSDCLKNFICDMAAVCGTEGYRVLANSICLSADVNAALDPIYPDVMIRSNACQINYGVCITKYTGSRGKYSTNDTSAEYMSKIRLLLDGADVQWQTGELGKVDAGGGGTVAMYIAKLGVDTVDLGVPVLCMHAPFEIVSKTDVYMAHRAILAVMGRA